MINLKSSGETQWVPVGRVHSANGLKGDLYIQIFSEEVGWHKSLNQIKLTLNPQSQSTKNLQKLKENQGVYQVSFKKPFKKGLKIQIENVSDRTLAEGFVNLLFYIPEQLLESKPGQDIYLREVLNFKVYNDKKYIGNVESFISNSVQDLMTVKKEDGETCEIPLIKEFTDKIDFENKKILMTLPEGLLDL
jgi:16S rRNA processing protein RimM